MILNSVKGIVLGSILYIMGFPIINSLNPFSFNLKGFVIFIGFVFLLEIDNVISSIKKDNEKQSRNKRTET